MYCTYEQVAAMELDVAGAGAGAEAGAGRLAASIAGATTSMYTFPPMAPTANATLAAGGMGPPYNHKGIIKVHFQNITWYKRLFVSILSELTLQTRFSMPIEEVFQVN